jgi:hypothetical protein
LERWLRAHDDDARELICIGGITLARGKIGVPPNPYEHFLDDYLSENPDITSYPKLSGQ